MSNTNPIYGRDKILAVRRLKDATTTAGVRLALQIEHTLNYERDSEQKQTKDGPINTDGGLTVTLSLTAVATKDAVNTLMRQSVIDGDKLEFWEIDLSSGDGTGEYDALYMRGNLVSWDAPANVEDTVDISTEANIDGKPVEGKVTLTEEQEEQIQYAFFGLEKVDTVP